jgi:hypothetical protein
MKRVPPRMRMFFLGTAAAAATAAGEATAEAARRRAATGLRAAWAAKEEAVAPRWACDYWISIKFGRAGEGRVSRESERREGGGKEEGRNLGRKRLFAPVVEARSKAPPTETATPGKKEKKPFRRLLSLSLSLLPRSISDSSQPRLFPFVTPSRTEDPEMQLSSGRVGPSRPPRSRSSRDPQTTSSQANDSLRSRVLSTLVCSIRHCRRKQNTHMQRNRHSEKPEINQRKAQRGTQKRESHLDGDDIGRSAGTGDDAAAASSGGSDGRSRGVRERKVHGAKKERCERERKEDDGRGIK